MRKDMRDIIIDTGRRYKDGRKGRQNNPSKFDDLPDKERMRQGRGWYIERGDRLGPLSKYLLKQVGRPWNDVYADICKHADSRSLRGYHLRQHVEHDKVVGHKYSYSRGEVGRDRITGCWHPTYDLYIDDDGILCKENKKEASEKNRKEHAKYYARLEKRRAKNPPAGYVHIEAPNPTIKNDDSSWYEQIKGIWYYMEKEMIKCFKYIHPITEKKMYDFASKIHKEQLSKKELKDLGIKNENQS